MGPRLRGDDVWFPKVAMMGTEVTILTTARLRLEPIGDSHFDGLQAMNSDPAVMRYITGAAETPDETRASIERVKARWADTGYSWWAFVEHASDELVGAGAIQHLGRDPANPLEIAWRLRQDRWGQGLASEAARTMAAFAFDTLHGQLLCAVCDPANTGSSRVMERLGMRYKAQENWYERAVSVYEITREQWLSARAAAS